MHRSDDRPVTPGVHTYSGSCRCGAVRFEVDLDLMAGTTRCNCTYCTKTGWWGVIVKPAAFRLTAGADLFAQRDPAQWAVRRFCPTCHLNPYGEGDIPQIGGPFVSINVRCLDGVDLTGVPIRHLDGQHDTWAELNVTRWTDDFRPTA